MKLHKKGLSNRKTTAKIKCSLNIRIPKSRRNEFYKLSYRKNEIALKKIVYPQNDSENKMQFKYLNSKVKAQ